ncbi:MAG: hypothetical protein ABFD69_14340 [Candidatus Sumerlaeia bacterium]
MGEIREKFRRELELERKRFIGAAEGGSGERFTSERGSVIEFFPRPAPDPVKKESESEMKKVGFAFAGSLLLLMGILVLLPKVWPTVETNDIVAMVVCMPLLMAAFFVPFGYLVFILEKGKMRIKERYLRRSGAVIRPEDDSSVLMFQEICEASKQPATESGVTAVKPQWLCIEAGTFRARLHTDDLELELVPGRVIFQRALVVHARFGKNTWSMKILHPKGRQLLKKIQAAIEG